MSTYIELDDVIAFQPGYYLQKLLEHKNEHPTGARFFASI